MGGVAMDAARRYIGGDQHCGRTSFAGTIPKYSLAVARSRFLPVSWHDTRLLSQLRFKIQFVLTGLRSPPNRCIQPIS